MTAAGRHRVRHCHCDRKSWKIGFAGVVVPFSPRGLVLCCHLAAAVCLPSLLFSLYPCFLSPCPYRLNSWSVWGLSGLSERHAFNMLRVSSHRKSSCPFIIFIILTSKCRWALGKKMQPYACSSWRTREVISHSHMAMWRATSDAQACTAWCCTASQLSLGEFASHQNFTSETWIWWVVVWTRTSYVFCWDSIAACRIWDFAFVDIAINEYDLSNIVCHAGISVRLLRQMRSSLALVFVEVTAYQAVGENVTWGRGVFWLGSLLTTDFTTPFSYVTLSMMLLLDCHSLFNGKGLKQFRSNIVKECPNVAKTKLDLDRLASIIDRVDVAVVRELAAFQSLHCNGQDVVSIQFWKGQRLASKHLKTLLFGLFQPSSSFFSWRNALTLSFSSSPPFFLLSEANQANRFDVTDCCLSVWHDVAKGRVLSFHIFHWDQRIPGIVLASEVLAAVQHPQVKCLGYVWVHARVAALVRSKNESGSAEREGLAARHMTCKENPWGFEL